MKTEKRPKGRPPKEKHLLHTQVFNLRLRQEMYDRLKQQALKEERDMTYLVRVFVQAGLDERAKGAAK